LRVGRRKVDGRGRQGIAGQERPAHVAIAHHAEEGAIVVHNARQAAGTSIDRAECFQQRGRCGHQRKPITILVCHRWTPCLECLAARRERLLRAHHRVGVMVQRILGVIPARGGSQGLPGKNIRPLAGTPLIGHSLAVARLVPEITRTIVTTDDEEIASVAEALGGDVPFLRPAHLAEHTTPAGPVIAHALTEVERAEDSTYDAIVLLEPTSPLRDPQLLSSAIALLESEPEVDGVVSVAQPSFDPASVGVRTGPDGLLQRFFPEAAGLTRRQDSDAAFLKLTGNFYVWRSDFVRRIERSWLDEGRFLPMMTPNLLAFAIDTEEDFLMVEAVVEAGLVSLPDSKPAAG
jgi:N-acylneuraminate cytidylyltransferase